MTGYACLLAFAAKHGRAPAEKYRNTPAQWDHKRTIVMWRLHGATYREIGELSGVTAERIKQLLGRCERIGCAWLSAVRGVA